MRFDLFLRGGAGSRSWVPRFWDGFALILLFGLLATLATHAMQMGVPYRLGEVIPIHLGIQHLPGYAVRTVLRLFAALGLSLLSTFTVGYLIARNKHVERFLLPLIDVLQSVPILGFLSITIVGFIALFPNQLWGPECAAIFAIFTCQTWNMILGFYQSIKTTPQSLVEACTVFQLSRWQQFWRIFVPFAMPSLVWNTMISLSSSWFFITLSEAIIVNRQEILLPGIGSYIAVAVERANTPAVWAAILTMLVVILLYDQLIFRPLVSWSHKFRLDEAESGDEDSPVVSLFAFLVRRSKVFRSMLSFFSQLWNSFINIRWGKPRRISEATSRAAPLSAVALCVWYGGGVLLTAWLILWLIQFVRADLTLDEIGQAFLFGGYTSIRIVVLILICLVIWIPIGVWVGLHPRCSRVVQPIAQFFAAFPANLLFPGFVWLIIRWKLNSEIWMSPLLILGTQWYLLFNVIAGTSMIPRDLRQATRVFGVKRWLWWKKLALPAIFPYVITGAITAAGGAWNASIVAESMHWGKKAVESTGIGSYVAHAALQGDFPREALGIAVMCLYVLLCNRLIWQPLYTLAAKRFTLE